ncbi:RNA polymerase subunit sigma-70 [Williamsia sp. Leaf354]|uniref:RNA polymerase sigma factor n=1 Tax=Williamsia sp. Leaf354 TaxID=1736349 RepID=UPI0006FF80CA|nr:sigma-70 family RNA polymerase sigma factor [Williamsia sp. Leaf354]KQR99860.1 RNA polymerase subunit sigma-70 [Williamsia sp. Leaf354]
MWGDDQDGVVLTDRELVEHARLGDRGAFDSLVDRFGPRLHGYARRMVSDECTVQEVVQDSFVAAWRGLDTFRHEGSVQTWLFAICSRKIIDAYRKRSPIPIGDDILDLGGPSTLGLPLSATTSDAFVDALEKELSVLPPRQRAAWILREVEQMPFGDIGEVLGVASAAARGHYARARTTLRGSMRSWQ